MHINVQLRPLEDVIKADGPTDNGFVNEVTSDASTFWWFASGAVFSNSNPCADLLSASGSDCASNTGSVVLSPLLAVEGVS